MSVVRIERNGNRIWAEIPYAGGRGPIEAKRVDGYRWNKANKVWTYPLDLHTCRALRRVFKGALEIGPDLAAWARNELEREKVLARTAGLTLDTTLPLPNVERLAPEMAKAMYNRGFQTVAAVWGATNRTYLLADVPGLGKSIEAFAGLLEGNIVAGRVLIIAPKTAVRLTWEHEVHKWLGDLATAYVATGAREDRQRVIAEMLAADPTNHLRILIINAEMVRWKKGNPATRTPDKIQFPQLFDVEWDAIIGDEVHKYLMRSNPRSNNVSQVGYGFQQLQHAEDGMRIALTGTPMKGKPKNLWPTLHWLRPKTYTSQWNWMGRYYKWEPNAYSTSGKTYTDELLEDAELQLAQDLTNIMLRRTKDELHKINPEWAPPPKTYIEVFVDLSPAERKAYRRIEDAAEIHFKNQVMMVNGLLAEMTRLKQAAGSTLAIEDGNVRLALPSAKVEWLLDDFLPSRGITGDLKTEQGQNKVIIASQFTQWINLAHNALLEAGISCFKLTGQTSDGERERQVRMFQDNPKSARVFLLNTNAGGVSLTLDAADDVVIIDETWNPDDQLQVEDRAHRTSRTDHYVNVTYVRARGTIEEDIAAANEYKDQVQHSILDAARGIEWARAKYGAKLTEERL